MTIALREEGFLVNHKKVCRLMQELQIQSIIRKERHLFKGKSSKIFPNVVERQFQNRKQNEVLVTDITYLPFKDNFLYLSIVQDIYNNEIVAWKLSHRNDLQLVLETLDLATKKRDVYGTIIHSDQGFQYTSHAYHLNVKLISPFLFMTKMCRHFVCRDKKIPIRSKCFS
ncbi:DDE-type integrase/transposase/recombinase [Bacillus cereus]|uniref:DDE-type integrase/transposase/recombinase n=1 Tax=Bacillus cereus TaxID=1396 RepID=UPI00398056ED